jgi:hypothetical protein
MLQLQLARALLGVALLVGVALACSKINLTCLFWCACWLITAICLLLWLVMSLPQPLL